MKYIIPVLVAVLFSACGKKVTYHERRKPTAAEVEEQTPQAIARAKQMFALAYDGLPDKSFNITKENAANILLYGKGRLLDLVDVELKYQYDPTCKPGTMAYVTHQEITETKWQSTMNFCDYFYNRPLNEQAQTIMHELAHVIEGTGECRAMLFEFWVAKEAIGYYTPNDYYWNLNQCGERGYNRYLPGVTSTIAATLKDDEGSRATIVSRKLMADPEHTH